MTTPRYEQALALAHAWHASQLRKGTDVPYVQHLEGVADLVARHGGSEDERIAGLLHDALEDAPTQDEADRRREEIRTRFGEAVLTVVEACTDAEPAAKQAEKRRAGADRRRGWLERKLRYIEHLAHAPGPVLLVSAADKRHNAGAIVADLGTVGPAVFHRFSAGRSGTLWYYRSLWAMLALRAEDEPRIEAMVEELNGLVRAMG